jgi:hypothetical protein
MIRMTYDLGNGQGYWAMCHEQDWVTIVDQ